MQRIKTTMTSADYVSVPTVTVNGEPRRIPARAYIDAAVGSDDRILAKAESRKLFEGVLRTLRRTIR